MNVYKFGRQGIKFILIYIYYNSNWVEKEKSNEKKMSAFFKSLLIFSEMKFKKKIII